MEPPDRGPRKAKQYLFPSELLQLINCKDVPFAWRRSVVLTVYLYVRPGEADARAPGEAEFSVFSSGDGGIRTRPLWWTLPSQGEGANLVSV